MDWTQCIRADPHVLHGAVSFVGTRIPVSMVLDNLADGATPEAILLQYPGLRPEYIPAALAYAAEKLPKVVSP